jgi:hypothetical protein
MCAVVTVTEDFKASLKTYEKESSNGQVTAQAER